ncbi:MAG: sialidase family protein [Thermoguttaceae bacterium]
MNCVQSALAVEVKVVAGGESAIQAAECRRVIIGPGVNQPDPHPGYHGVVAWNGLVRLRNGTLVLSFSTGYWHASPPTPLRGDEEAMAEWKKAGMPTDVNAPTGGRAMLVRSTDGGRTWSKPETIVDTPADDRSPALVELPSGVLLCSMFTLYGLADPEKHPELATRTAILRSLNGGQTWEPRLGRLPSPLIGDATDLPPIVLKDGSAILAVYGSPARGKPEQVALFRSTDDGQTWKLLSQIPSDHEMSEMGLTQLPDGRLVLITRSEGDILWSSDGGRTWTKPTSLGMRMFEPGLTVLRDGTLVCLHGSYAPGAGGLRVIFSRDGGQTWIAPARDHGFAVDAHVYGYGRCVEMPDGTLLAVYIKTGCHRDEDRRRGTLLAVRFRIRPDYSGIDVLPAPAPAR